MLYVFHESWCQFQAKFLPITQWWVLKCCWVTGKERGLILPPPWFGKDASAACSKASKRNESLFIMSQRFPFSLHSLSLFRPFLLLNIHQFKIYFQASFHFPLSQFSFPFILVIFTSSLHKIHKRLSSSLLCCYRRYPSKDVFLAEFF